MLLWRPAMRAQLLLVGEVLQLQADDLSSDVCSEVLGLSRGGGEESGFFWVRARTGVDVGVPCLYYRWRRRFSGRADRYRGAHYS